MEYLYNGQYGVATDRNGLCPDSNSAFKNFCIGIYHVDWSAVGHTALDIAGVFFDGADALNAFWYACEGNMEMAAASAVSAIPGLGIGTGSLMMKTNKLAQAGRVIKTVSKLTQSGMGVVAGIEMAKVGFTNFMNGLESGILDGKNIAMMLGGIFIAGLSEKGMVSSGRAIMACTENAGRAAKGKGWLTDADISGKPIESKGMPTYRGQSVIKSGRNITTTIDYSYKFDRELANFNDGYEIRTTVDKDLILVQYSSDAPDASLCFWITVDEANGIITLNDYMDKLALSKDWGNRNTVKVVRIPVRTKVKYAVGTAKEQSLIADPRPGGGVQYLFNQFDTDWITEIRSFSN